LIELNQITSSAFPCSMQSLVNYSGKSILKQSGYQKKKTWSGKDRLLVSAAAQAKQPSFLFLLQTF